MEGDYQLEEMERIAADLEYENVPSDVMAEVLSPEASGVESIETLDALLDGKGRRYGLPFDLARGYLYNVEQRLSAAVGWKSDRVPYDFSGFTGFRLEYDAAKSEYTLLENNEGVCRFFAREDGSLGFEAYSEEFDQYGPEPNAWYPLSDLMDGKYVLSLENIARAKEECHDGNVLIYGLRYAGATAFAWDGDDLNASRQLADRELNIRFVKMEDMRQALSKYIEKAFCIHGFEPEQRPELIMYAYDGMTIRSELELAVDYNYTVDGESLVERNQFDWETMDYIRAEIDKIRYELERAAGIENESRHFRFRDVWYPDCMIRPDTFVLCPGGRVTELVMTCVHGRMVNLDLDTGKVLSWMESMTPKEYVDYVRGEVLSEKNVSLARDEYKEFKARKTLRRFVSVESRGHDNGLPF